MSETVAKLLESADESVRVFGLRNQIVIAPIGGRTRNGSPLTLNEDDGTIVIFKMK